MASGGSVTVDAGNTEALTCGNNVLSISAEEAGKIRCEASVYLASLPIVIERLATAIHGHWGVEPMHWILDVLFKDGLSRYRQGHGAKNMALVRRFALDLVRPANIKGSVKKRRMVAVLSPKALLQILNA